ncbi:MULTISPECIES: hypothetical protein [Streptomyces]|uniref:WXG100 family type VII secretion target n=1 Tax=Streptomyces ramulosus TaxID=47762 RepID=A0ABW1FFA0_9ACTN
MSENKGGVTTDKGCFYAKHETKFYQYDMDQLKAMVADAKPGKVKEIATNWKWIHDTLIGTDGRGGLRKEFDDAVKEVLESWGGQAAEGFRRTAQKISENIGNAGPWAINMHDIMNGVEASLSDYKKKIDAMEKPSGTESNLDAVGNYGLKVVTFGAKGGRDDSKANSELAAGKPTEDVLNGNSGELSEGKERQLQTAIIMEYLGSSYRSNVAAIGKPPHGTSRDQDVPPPGGDTPVPPPFVPVPDSVMNPPKPSAKANIPTPHGGGYKSPVDLEGPRHDGISGGLGSTMPAKSSTLPNIGTGLDSFSGGGGAGGGGLSGTGGGGLAGGAGIGGGSGVGGGSGTSSSGVPGGAAGLIGGGAAGRGAAGGAGARGGRAGMPGMGGAAGRGAGGAKGGAAAGRGSALAKQKGGVVGGAKGKTGGGAQGGSGLHRSRGGSQKGSLGGRRPMGMAGAPGVNGAKGRGKNENGERPDYLVEDEETWTPERNVAPKVIE